MFTSVRRAEPREAAGRVERPNRGHPGPLQSEHHAPPGADPVRGCELGPGTAELPRRPPASSARTAQLRAPDLTERAHQQHHHRPAIPHGHALLTAELRRELARDALHGSGTQQLSSGNVARCV